MDKLGEGHPAYLACKLEYEGLKRLSEDQATLHIMVDERNATRRIQRRLQSQAREYGRTVGSLFDFDPDRTRLPDPYVRSARRHGNDLIVGFEEPLIDEPYHHWLPEDINTPIRPQPFEEAV
jgi:hypothetical protein